MTIGAREGSFAGMPMARDFTATIHLPARPQNVTLDGAAVTDYQWEASAATVTVKIPACGKTPRVLTLE